MVLVEGKIMLSIREEYLEIIIALGLGEGVSANMRVGEILEVELWGLFISLKMALDKVARRILVEFDSAVLVSLVKCTGHELHPLASLLYGG
ncbi:unnamed protein product [Malus baccata var. baccata]